jgi:hypothetical protein
MSLSRSSPSNYLCLIFQSINAFFQLCPSVIFLLVWQVYFHSLLLLQNFQLYSLTYLHIILQYFHFCDFLVLILVFQLCFHSHMSIRASSSLSPLFRLTFHESCCSAPFKHPDMLHALFTWFIITSTTVFCCRCIFEYKTLDISKAWETFTENIKISVNESLSYY